MGPVAPGEIISIFGQGMGPASGMNLNLTSRWTRREQPRRRAGPVRRRPAPLLYARQDQINLVVPYSVAGKRSVHFTVQYQGGQSAPSEILVADAAPAIFTADQSGQGQGAILNQDTSVNSDLNPADRGSIVTIFASGAGLLDPAGQDGAVSAGPGSVVLPVSVLVDGENTNLTYAGPAPGLVSGVLQVNFRTPTRRDDRQNRRPAAESRPLHQPARRQYGDPRSPVAVGSIIGRMAKAANPIPTGFHTLTPHLTVDGAAKYIDFLKQAFDAVEMHRSPGLAAS